ncbi:MAG: restriction endonuclease subunit S [Candidatus Doudnabacteria bacterium]
MDKKNKNNWQTKKLGEVLEYEQPSLYIVSSKNYKDDYETPVLTAGKSFILGKTKEKNGIFPKDKLPVIIFDDFTTATKFVDFPFKVKSSAMKILHPVKNISDAKFLFYLIQNISFDHTGIHKRYWISEYSKIEIFLPPLPEQQRIVKLLDEVFEKTSKAKENAEKNLNNSKELFESYLQSVFANPGKDWEEKKLGESYDVRDGTHDSPKYQKEGYALITSKNLKRDELDYRRIKYISEKDYQKINDRSKVHKGDILFAMIGTIGNPVVVKVEPDFAIKNVALFKIPKEQNSYFLKYFLDSKFVIDKMTREAKGTTQKFVGLGYLRNFKIKLPILSEQKAIVAKLDVLSAETKKLEAIYQKKVMDLEELKKSVLKRAFNGDL